METRDNIQKFRKFKILLEVWAMKGTIVKIVSEPEDDGWCLWPHIQWYSTLKTMQEYGKWTQQLLEKD